ncbi:DEAD/DEAH box helicase [Marinospirillum sp. MEB164]|uniref:DEAD/DEAH box helicase n=1 Tax=Marinospirillum alkalitolerans TaxID=3123374 RepID=A0ABW8PZY2_9GAMM
MQLEKILSYFDLVRPSGPQDHRAACPCCARDNARKRKERRLVITEKPSDHQFDRSRVVFFCYAGHSHNEIRDAVGLTAQDLITDERSFSANEKREWARKKAEESAANERLILTAFSNKKRRGLVTPEDEKRAAQAQEKISELLGKPAVNATHQTPRQALIKACYEHKAGINAQGLEKAAQQVGVDPAKAQQWWAHHLAGRAMPLHQSIPVAKKFTKFSSLEKALAEGKSAFVQAPLGAGKTSGLAKPLIEKARKAGRPVLAVTVLRSLAGQNAETLELDIYTERPEIIELSRGVSSTVHGATRESMMPLIQQLANFDGLLVIDEAAQVSGLLFGSASILSGQQKERFLALINGCALFGIQVVALDGDITPTTAHLVKQLNLPVFSCNEQAYLPPKVELYPAQRVKIDGKTKDNQPLHESVIKSLQDGRKTVIFCTTRRGAEAAHALYSRECSGRSLLLTSRTTAEPEQARFLSDPNGQAPDYQLIIYSPVLSSGFSVTSIEAQIFGLITHDSLDAPAIWQLARRFRRAAGGTIQMAANSHFMRPQREYMPAQELELEAKQAAWQDGGEAAINCTFTAGQIAALQQKNLNSSNPFLILHGHLLNAGIQVSTCFESSREGIEEVAQAQLETKEREIESTRTAERINELEADHLSAVGAGTEKAAAKLARYQIEQALQLGYVDFDSAGNLPHELAKEAIFGGLIKQVERQTLLKAAAAGVDLDTLSGDTEQSVFAFKKHTAQQVELMNKILDDLKNEAGEIQFTGTDAERLSATFRKAVKPTYHLITKPPAAKAPKRLHTAWLKNLLTSWGFELKSARASGWRKATDQWVYSAGVAADAEKFSARKIAVLKLKFPTQENDQLHPESLMCQGLEGVTG